MARTATKRKPAVSQRKKRATRKKPTTQNPKILVRVLLFISLFLLLFFSVSMVGYVIFFRTVVAGELPFEERDITFEEPYQPHEKQILPPDRSPVEFPVPKVAIIIDDMGYHPEEAEGLLNLDLNLSFSFLPFAPFTEELEEKAYQKGREVLLHQPLEPRSDKWDPGPGALYLNEESGQRKKIFTRNLLLVPHATGVNTHMGSRYSEDYQAMFEFAELLKEQELFFVDSYTTASSNGLRAARAAGVLSARRHVFLDNVQNTAEICRQVGLLVSLAAQYGSAVGIGHPYPETLEALGSCGREILENVQLVHVSQLVQ